MVDHKATGPRSKRFETCTPASPASRHFLNLHHVASQVSFIRGARSVKTSASPRPYDAAGRAASAPPEQADEQFAIVFPVSNWAESTDPPVSLSRRISGRAACRRLAVAPPHRRESGRSGRQSSGFGSIALAGPNGPSSPGAGRTQESLTTPYTGGSLHWKPVGNRLLIHSGSAAHGDGGGAVFSAML